jgi:hypothetical protein
VVYDTVDWHICTNIPEELGASMFREAANSSDMSVTSCQLTGHYISEDFNFHYTVCLLLCLVIVQSAKAYRRNISVISL